MEAKKVIIVKKPIVKTNPPKVIIAKTSPPKIVVKTSLPKFVVKKPIVTKTSPPKVIVKPGPPKTSPQKKSPESFADLEKEDYFDKYFKDEFGNTLYFVNGKLSNVKEESDGNKGKLTGNIEYGDEQYYFDITRSFKTGTIVKRYYLLRESGKELIYQYQALYKDNKLVIIMFLELRYSILVINFNKFISLLSENIRNFSPLNIDNYPDVDFSWSQICSELGKLKYDFSLDLS